MESVEERINHKRYNVMISLMESEKEEGKWDIINFRRNCGREVSVKNTNSQIQPVQKSQAENKKIIIKKSQLDIS